MTQSVIRDQVLGRLATIVEERSKQGTVRVAIDGVDVAGKTTLADELAQVLRRAGVPVLRASIDGFHNPASVRHRRSADQPARSYYEDSFDYLALRGLLLDPLGMSTTRCGERGRPSITAVSPRIGAGRLGAFGLR